jgi:peptidoglycan/LPS O-acetylase OafA/YrhL
VTEPDVTEPDAAPGSESPAAVQLPDHRAFPALDGLRALAVFAIVLTHAAFRTGRYVRGSGSAILAHLDIGVAVFFVISGFLLSREWFVAAADGREPVRLQAYYWRRGLRIMPLYWATVIFALVALPENRSATAGDWLRHAFLLQTYSSGWLREGLTQTWSLCCEASFYLVLPAIAGGIVRLAGRMSPTVAVVSVSAALGIANVGWLIFIHVGAGSSSTFAAAGFWLPSYLSWFAAGIAMAGLHTQLTRTSSPALAWAAELGAHPGVCWTFAGGAYLLIVTPLTGPLSLTPVGGGQAVAKNLLYLVFAVALLWPAVFASGPLVHAIFANRPMRYLGDISYGVFLIHLVFVEASMSIIGDPIFTGSATLVFLITLAITIPLAALSYRWIEVPAMRLRRLVPSRAPVPSGPVAAGTSR